MAEAGNYVQSYKVFIIAIIEKTLPSTPFPPDEVRVTLVTPTSVHLNIRPRHPLNGWIRLFVVRVGVVTDEDSDSVVDKIIWRKR